MSGFFSKFLWLSFLLFMGFCLHGQEKLILQLKSEPGTERILQKYKIPETFSDTLALSSAVNGLLQTLRDEGYLMANLETVNFSISRTLAVLNIGARFEWLALAPGNVSEGLLRKIGFRDRLFAGKPFRYPTVAGLQKRLLDYGEQNGYPFSQVFIDSLKIEQNHFQGTLKFDLGPPITFDSIRVTGNSGVKASFLGRYLGIVLGEPYDQRHIDNISRALNNLPYLRLSKNPSLTFQNSEATISLELERRPINQIDGIIGFLPNAREGNRLVITGQFDIELYSPFGRGRHIGIHWQKLNVNSQNLNLQYEQPNLLKGPLDLNSNFKFLKEDSLFTNRNLRLEFDYRLSGRSALSLFTDFKTTRLLATSIYENNTELPDLLDFDYTSYGLRFQWTNLDDAFLPKRGSRFWLEGAAGNKKIVQNTGIAPELYANVPLKTFQYTLSLQGERYWRLGSQFVLLNRLNMAKVVNDRLLRNDAYRLGGFNTIRGFNENFFFATGYAYLTSEVRFFLDELSYLSLFSDLGQLESKFEGVNRDDTVLGIGAGVTFSTNAGVFNFVYALGSSNQQQGLNLSQSKIHFGYISRF